MAQGTGAEAQRSVPQLRPAGVDQIRSPRPDLLARDPATLGDGANVVRRKVDGHRREGSCSGASAGVEKGIRPYLHALQHTNGAPPRGGKSGDGIDEQI